MRAHILENGVIVNTVEVDSLDALENLVDASNGGSIGDQERQERTTSLPRQ
jgi:hypothetical protein